MVASISTATKDMLLYTMRECIIYLYIMLFFKGVENLISYIECIYCYTQYIPFENGAVLLDLEFVAKSLNELWLLAVSLLEALELPGKRGLSTGNRTSLDKGDPMESRLSSGGL